MITVFIVEFKKNVFNCFNEVFLSCVKIFKNKKQNTLFVQEKVIRGIKFRGKVVNYHEQFFLDIYDRDLTEHNFTHTSHY